MNQPSLEAQVASLSDDIAYNSHDLEDGLKANLFKIESGLASLIAVGTSICGASAIIAFSSTIPVKKNEVVFAIANITVFGIFAMLGSFFAFFIFCIF